MSEGVEEVIHKTAKNDAMTGELNFGHQTVARTDKNKIDDDNSYDDIDFISDPIDPLELILTNELELPMAFSHLFCHGE